MVRRSLVAVVIAVLAAAPTTAGASMIRDLDAAANEQGFLDAEHPWDTYWGGPASDQQLRSIGYQICDLHKRGHSDIEVLTRMLGGASMMSPVGSEARERGLQRVRNAKQYICP